MIDSKTAALWHKPKNPGDRLIYQNGAIRKFDITPNYETHWATKSLNKDHLALQHQRNIELRGKIFHEVLMMHAEKTKPVDIMAVTREMCR
tara:strand:+ start:652 stop:924 length:273 start_codon:yes stop_codon:yes gene_type:complete